MGEQPHRPCVTQVWQVGTMAKLSTCTDEPNIIKALVKAVGLVWWIGHQWPANNSHRRACHASCCEASAAMARSLSEAEP